MRNKTNVQEEEGENSCMDDDISNITAAPGNESASPVKKPQAPLEIDSRSAPTAKTTACLVALSCSSSLLRASLACLMTGVLVGIAVSWFNQFVQMIQGALGVPQLLGQKGELLLLILPCLGGLGVGLVQLLANASGLSVGVVPLPTMRASIHQSGTTKASQVSWKYAGSLFLHVVAAALALGFANSLGPTAPRVQLGARISTIVANLLQAWPAECEVLLAVGAAAGVASGAHAPLAGVVYGLEMIWPTAENRAMYFSLAMVGVVAAMTMSSKTLSVAGVLADSNGVRRGADPHKELYLFAIIGVFCGVLAWIFNNAFKPAFSKMWSWMQLRGVRKELHPGVAGLLAGLVAWQLAPEVLFMGWANFRKVLLQTTDFSVWELTRLSIVKLALTAAATTSGMPGGLFAPSMLAGAAAGGAFGLIAKDVFEDSLLSDIRMYSTVGMAAMHGSVNAVPCTALVLVFELSRDYEFVIPCICGLSLAYLSGAALDILSTK